MKRRSLERLVSRRPAGADRVVPGDTQGGVGGPGLSLLHGFWDDRRFAGLKVALIGIVLLLMGMVR